MKISFVSGCLLASLLSLAALLAGCTTPTRNPGGYARIISPNLLAAPSLNARIALERDGAGEVANVDLHPVLGIGFGLVGVRLTIFPIEAAFGAFGYPFTHTTPVPEKPEPLRRTPERRDDR